MFPGCQIFLVTEFRTVWIRLPVVIVVELLGQQFTVFDIVLCSLASMFSSLLVVVFCGSVYGPSGSLRSQSFKLVVLSSFIFFGGNCVR